LTVFEPFFADGLEAGPSAKRCVFIFFKKNFVPRAPGKVIGKGCFSIFLKKHVPRAPGKGRRQRRIFIF
jgi:hypothetical protein